MTFTVRRQALAISILGGLLLTAVPAIAQDSLSVMSFGGAYQEAQRKAVFETYTATTGIKVDEQEYGGEIAKIAAMISSGNTTIDVVDVDAPTLLQGCDEGIFETIDWEQIGDKADWLSGTTSDCGVGTIVYSTSLAYNAATLENGPTALADLFDTAKFPGKRGLWKNPATNLEFALLADGVPVDQVYEVLGTPEGLDRAFAKLDTIKDSIVWWEAGAQPPQLLADGEVVMATAYNGRIFAAAMNEGKPFQIVWDGQVYENEMFVVPKGAPNMADAMEFVKFATSTEGLRASAQQISYGPARKSAMKEEILFKDGYCGLARYIREKKLNR